MKRILSFLLVLTMLCGFAAAFAAEEAPAEEPAVEAQAVETAEEEPAEENAETVPEEPTEESAESLPEETAAEPAEAVPEAPAEEAAAAGETPVADSASEEPAEAASAPAADGAGLDAGSIPLALGGSATATVDKSHSYTYKINVTSAGRIELAWVSDGYYIWTYLYDANGNEVFHASGAWAPGSVKRNAYDIDLTAQTYYLVLSQCSDGAHEFTLTATRLTDAKETYKDTGTNNTLATASKAVLGTTYNGLIARNDDKDFYSFSVSSAETVQVKLIAQIAKVNLKIFDEDGDQLYSQSPSWNETTSQSSNVYSVELAAGTYYAAIEKNSGNTGCYSLTISHSPTYTVTYDANGGTGAPADQSKKSGETLTLSSTKPTRTGYTFLGWATGKTASAAEYAAGADYTDDAGVTLYAVWKARTYVITYNANEGTGAPDSQVKTHGKTLTLSSTKPTRTGYVFKGWATSSTALLPEYAAGGSFVSNKNVTLYAVWQIRTYVITYNANEGTGAPDSQTKTYGQALTLSSDKPARAGYTFLGWSESSTAASATYAAGGSYTANANTTLYAVWKLRTYAVTYDANGGSGAPADQTKTYGKTLTLRSEEPTRSGYIFQGWATSQTATEAQYKAGGKYSINKKVTLYAVWMEIPEGWLRLGDSTYYYKNGSKLTDWQKIDGSWYYFRTGDGSMATGWLILGEKRYYMQSTGVMATGWQKVGSNWYYLASNGVMQTGWQQINGSWYYFRTGSGSMLTGWLILDEGKYYMQSSGVMATGWQKVGSNWYYLASNGVMQTGWQKVNGFWYYLASSGRMLTGWFTDSNGKHYYLSTAGIMQTGWQKLDTGWYYFDDSGVRQTGWLKSGTNWYYLNSTGKMITGWRAIDGEKYYFNLNTGAMLTGWQKIGSDWYYFASSGRMVTGWLQYNSSWYYLKTSGKMTTGTYTVDGVAQNFDDTGKWIGRA